MKCMDKTQRHFFGQESCGKSFYHEIIVPEKIVYTDTFVDAEGNPAVNMPEVLVTMTFIEQEGKTKVISRSQFASIETLQQVKEMGVVEGVASQFGRLDLLLENIK